jgi:hypothetical protein
MIDWDLEAPGLHYYFHGKLKKNYSFKENTLDGQLGLIDLFTKVKLYLDYNKQKSNLPLPEDFFNQIDFYKYLIRTEIQSLYLMTAGRFDDNQYSTRINSFNWEEFFNSYPTAFSSFADFLRKRFKYILIDSRTGYTDISGICTSIMPEILVTVFIPNRQSVSGIIEAIRRSVNYRKQSDDLRPLIILPLPSRIENAENKLQREWRFGEENKSLFPLQLEEVVNLGYQYQFERIFKEIYNLKNCDLTKYFDEVQIQYIPRYSYGEEIAVLEERDTNRLSIKRSFENFVQKLTDLENPWESGLYKNRKEYDVFLSYDQKNSDQADTISNYLIENGINVFTALIPINSGIGNWDNEVKKALRTSNAFCVLITPDSINNELINIEIHAAWVLDVPIISIVLGVSINELPTLIRNYQSVDFSNYKMLTDYINNIKKLNGYNAQIKAENN